MSSDSAGGGSRRGFLRWGAGVVLVCAGMTAWVQMITAAGNGWSIEPSSDAAIAAAAAARPTALAWAVVLIVAACALAGVAGHRWLVVLGLPGLVVSALLLLAPTANGGTFFYGLLTSVVALGTAAHLEVRHRLRQRAAVRPNAY